MGLSGMWLATSVIGGDFGVAKVSNKIDVITHCIVSDNIRACADVAKVHLRAA